MCRASRSDGLLVIHISNRHLELQSVVAALARDASIAIKTRIHITKSTSLADPNSSAVAIFARQPETLARFTEELGMETAAGQ